jgi:hypothetical protein
MSINWKWAESVGIFALATAAEYAPKLVTIEPNWTWLPHVVALLMTATAILRMSPQGAAQLDAANRTIANLTLRLGDKL